MLIKMARLIRQMLTFKQMHNKRMTKRWNRGLPIQSSPKSLLKQYRMKMERRPLSTVQERASSQLTCSNIVTTWATTTKLRCFRLTLAFSLLKWFESDARISLQKTTWTMSFREVCRISIARRTILFQSGETILRTSFVRTSFNQKLRVAGQSILVLNDVMRLLMITK